VKISYLHICNYKQFLNLELDLTYPKGHKKAGEPLDKICIIGQSGVGKTNLLDIIKNSSIDFSTQPNNSYLPFSKFVGKDTDDKYITTKFITKNNYLAETLFTQDSSKITFKTMQKPNTNYMINNERIYYIGAEKNILKTNKVFNSDNLTRTEQSILDGLEKERENVERKGIAFYSSIEEFKEKLAELDKEIKGLKDKTKITNAIDKLKSDNFLRKTIIDLNSDFFNIWEMLKERIENYKNERYKIKDKLTNKLLNDDSYDKEHFKKDLEKWERENENILDKIADDLNFILNRFNLELTKIDENQTSYNALIVKDLSNDNILEYDSLSTGTKNLISTYLPLKILKPKESIILIDEPEISFYPNIQRELTDLYMNIGENNQLIIATHSPIIASSFEPWEVVELKFDNNNQIYREKYYNGENHIDNYTVDPRMLTWTGILTDVFDLTQDSNFSYREKKLMEYAALKEEIKAMPDKTSSKAQKKIKEFKKLSQLLGLQN
jgi:predicted ATPase